jgi:hypothetical protein
MSLRTSDPVTGHSTTGLRSRTQPQARSPASFAASGLRAASGRCVRYRASLLASVGVERVEREEPKLTECIV